MVNDRVHDVRQITFLHNIIPTRYNRGDMHSYKERERAARQAIDSLLLDAISEDGKVCNRDCPAGEHCLAVPEDNQGNTYTIGR